MASIPDDNKAIDMTAVMAEEFTQLHGGTFEQSPSLRELLDKIHALPPEDKRAALCLSGGGIRSASFALGVLQALAGKELLGRFHYLSTVSGGGYIAAWLSVWRKNVGDDQAFMEMLSGRRHEEADRLTSVARDLRLPKEGYDPDDAFMEPVELTRLRSNSNFLTPKLGAMSADTWTLVALYLRNLLLNWAVYLPMIIVLLLIPVFAREILLTVQGNNLTGLHHFILMVAILLFTYAVYTSVRGRLAEKNEDRVTQWAFLGRELAPIYIASMLVCVYSVGGCNSGTATDCWADKLSVWTVALIGGAIYLVAWATAYFVHGDKKERFFAAPTTSNPCPPAVLWLYWTLAGVAAGALVGLGLAAARTHATDPTPIVILGVGWIACSIFVANAIYLALTSWSRLGDVEREWLARSSGWFVAMTVIWGGFSALVFYSGDIVDRVHGLWGLLIGGGAGAVAARIGSSARTLGSFGSKPGNSIPMTTVLALASIVSLIALVVGLSTILLHELSGSPFRSHRLLASLIGIMACSGFAVIAAQFVNVNRFSAHSLYRNRLIRAFIGSARGPTASFGITRDPFTGFDPKDNVWVHEMAYPKEKGRTRLFPVINMALNTVAGANTAWQERMAESFSVTPLRSGNEWVQFWPTNNYGSQENGLSLGTAMAISGAAASPNQGYHSSPLVGLVMTLFNVRLGWWLGNPAKPNTAPRESPPFGMVQFISELFGLTNDNSKYVYLSDGGHFENLGLYEMVRRRCHFILVSDAGCDPKCEFEDLGNAVRKIRIDLGIEIRFQNIRLEKRGKPDRKNQGVYCAVGTIKYPESDELGHLLYLKPSFLGTEPADIRAYAFANPAFPHETTADQFFSESQMESYRSLGAHVTGAVLGDKVVSEDPRAPIKGLGPYWANIQKFA
jgi:hypothetical protein